MRSMSEKSRWCHNARTNSLFSSSTKGVKGMDARALAPLRSHLSRTRAGGKNLASRWEEKSNQECLGGRPKGSKLDEAFHDWAHFERKPTLSASEQKKMIEEFVGCEHNSRLSLERFIYIPKFIFFYNFHVKFMWSFNIVDPKSQNQEFCLSSKLLTRRGWFDNKDNKTMQFSWVLTLLPVRVIHPLHWLLAHWWLGSQLCGTKTTHRGKSVGGVLVPNL